MPKFASFDEVPLSAIEPEGWLRRWLETQRDGLTGHLEAAGYPFNTPGWASSRVVTRGFEDWAPYEQNAYWVDGMIRCGRLLGDPFLIAKARKQINYVLARPDRDGYLGPALLKKEMPLTPDLNIWLDGIKRWSHAVFFRALMAEYSATGDERIVKALKKHYLNGTCSHSCHRNVCNVEPILWTYDRTGDPRLLEHAVEAYEAHNRLFPEMDTTVANMRSNRRATEHGVTYNEIGKLAAIMYMHTGRRRTLEAAINGFRKLDRDQMLIDGVPSSSESLRGKGPLDSHETCDITDYTWAVGYLLMATGRAEYADKIERACFNAGPGAVRSDFKGLQYFSCPNQVIADRRSNHNEFFRGEKWMSYRPNPGTECCPGDVHRFMPNYAARMWLAGRDGAPVAALYGPSRFTFNAGGAGPVTLVEETDYPFSERIDFQIRAGAPVRFPLSLRIPGWCRGARVLLNGRPMKAKPKAGSFFRLNRVFNPNDRVTLFLPMRLKLSRWPQGGVGIERGPLVFALRVEEDWRVDRGEQRATREFPAWNLYPASPWNVALAVDGKRLARDVEIVHREVGPEPWSLDGAPIELRVPARRVRGWTLDRRRSIVQGHTVDCEVVQRRVKGDFAFTPPLPDPSDLPGRLSKRVERVRLVPYGCTHLRISVFPWGK